MIDVFNDLNYEFEKGKMVGVIIVTHSDNVCKLCDIVYSLKTKKEESSVSKKKLVKK